MKALLARVVLGREVIRDGSIELKIANSRVMGAHMVTTTATLMAFAGFCSLTGLGGSALLTQFGGHWLDLLWAWTFVLAWVLVMASRCWEKKDAIDAAWLEIGGILMISAVFGLFTYIVMKYAGSGGGTLFLTCGFLAQILNMLGRGVLLAKRIIWLGRAATR